MCFVFENQGLPGGTCILVASDKRTKSLGLSLPSVRRVMSNEEGVCEALRGGGVALSSELS